MKRPALNAFEAKAAPEPVRTLTGLPVSAAPASVAVPATGRCHKTLLRFDFNTRAPHDTAYGHTPHRHTPKARGNTMKTTLTKTLLASAVIAMTVGASTAHAEREGGYVSASIGSTFYDQNDALKDTMNVELEGSGLRV